MRHKILMVGALAAASLAAAPQAEARQGCGPGFHRNYHGYCVANRGTVVFEVGRFYPGRGWWDGHRWWAHRDRDDRGHWRYHR